MRAEDLSGVILLTSLAVFLLPSFQASEFALLQHIVPQDRFASLAGLYNGASIVIGGGLGPYLLEPIIGRGEGTWIVSVVALAGGAMLIILHAKVKY